MKLTRFSNDYPGQVPLDRLYAKLADISAHLYPSETEINRQKAARLLLLAGSIKARLLSNDASDPDNHKVVFELRVAKDSPKVADALRDARGNWYRTSKFYGKLQRRRRLPAGSP